MLVHSIFSSKNYKIILILKKIEKIFKKIIVIIIKIFLCDLLRFINIKRFKILLKNLLLK